MAKPNYDKMKKNIQDQVGEGSLMRAEDDKALMGSIDESAAQGKESLKLRDTAKDIMARQTRLADEGMSAEEREQMKSKMSKDMAKAQQIAGLRMGAAGGGLKGSAAAAQQRSMMAQAMASRMGIQRDVFLQNEAVKRQGLQGMLQAQGAMQGAEQTIGAAMQRDVENRARRLQFDAAQQGKEKEFAVNTELAFAQMESADYQAGLEADAYEKANSGTVLCTAAFGYGKIPEHIFEADIAYGKKMISKDVLKGYQFWAKPLTKLMHKSKLVQYIMMPIIKAWAYHMAYLMGTHDKPNLAGKFLLGVVAPICGVIGKVVRRK